MMVESGSVSEDPSRNKKIYLPSERSSIRNYKHKNVSGGWLIKINQSTDTILFLAKTTTTTVTRLYSVVPIAV